MPRLMRLVGPPAAPAPAPVAMDNADVVAALGRVEAKLDLLIAETRKKKRWSFTIAKDQFGRPFQMDAEQK